MTIRKLILVIIIGFILFGLSLLSLLGIINMNSMLLVLLSSGIFSILTGCHNTKNKKLATFLIVAGLFSFLVAVVKTFFLIRIFHIAFNKYKNTYSWSCSKCSD